MSDRSPADLYLVRLAAKPPYRWTIYTVFLLTAIASLYQRVGLGRNDQVLPWYGSFLALYGLGMAVVARDNRCRIIYGSFGLLVAVAFTRRFLGGWTRAVGIVEVGSCLALLAAFARLGAAEGLGPANPMVESDAPKQRMNQEDSNE